MTDRRADGLFHTVILSNFSHGVNVVDPEVVASCIRFLVDGPPQLRYQALVHLRVNTPTRNTEWTMDIPNTMTLLEALPALRTVAGEDTDDPNKGYVRQLAAAIYNDLLLGPKGAKGVALALKHPSSAVRIEAMCKFENIKAGQPVMF